MNIGSLTRTGVLDYVFHTSRAKPPGELTKYIGRRNDYTIYIFNLINFNCTELR